MRPLDQVFAPKSLAAAALTLTKDMVSVGDEGGIFWGDSTQDSGSGPSSSSVYRVKYREFIRTFRDGEEFVYRDMLRRVLQPDAQTLNSLINAYAKAGLVDEASTSVVASFASFSELSMVSSASGATASVDDDDIAGALPVPEATGGAG